MQRQVSEGFVKCMAVPLQTERGDGSEERMCVCVWFWNLEGKEVRGILEGFRLLSNSSKLCIDSHPTLHLTMRPLLSA